MRRAGGRRRPDPTEEPEAAIFRIAEAITNGKRIDWNAERLDPAAAATELANLQALEALAEVHGGLQGSRPEPIFGTWGPLQLLERIGAGSFGEVYRAYDPALQRQVALKLRSRARGADDPAARRFVREARMLARIQHPNVLVVHGADQNDGRAGLWTDLLRGRTLEQILLEQGPFSAREAALIGIDMCGALAAVHAAGLVHRDVKTANIMREQGGRIVLMDFGSGGEQPGGRPAAARISSGGTPLYMAPEQLLEAAEAVAASDLYSLGVVLHRLVTARYPFEAETLADLIEKHRRRERGSLIDARPDLPPAYVHVVERALARNPLRRYSSAGSMERDLRAVLGAAHISTPYLEGGGWPKPLAGRIEAVRQAAAPRSRVAGMGPGALVAGALAAARAVARFLSGRGRSGGRP